MKIHKMGVMFWSSLCGVDGDTLRAEYEAAKASGTLPDPMTKTPPETKCLDCLKVALKSAADEFEEAKRAQIEAAPPPAAPSTPAPYLSDEDLLCRD